MLWIAAILGVLAAFAFFLDTRRASREQEPPAPGYEPYASGHVVPPLPGQDAAITRRAKATVVAAAVGAGIDAAADDDVLGSGGQEVSHE